MKYRMQRLRKQIFGSLKSLSKLKIVFNHKKGSRQRCKWRWKKVILKVTFVQCSKKARFRVKNSKANVRIWEQRTVSRGIRNRQDNIKNHLIEDDGAVLLPDAKQLEGDTSKLTGTNSNRDTVELKSDSKCQTCRWLTRSSMWLSENERERKKARRNLMLSELLCSFMLNCHYLYL